MRTRAAARAAACAVVAAALTGCQAGPASGSPTTATSGSRLQLVPAASRGTDPARDLPPRPGAADARCHARGALPDPACTPGATDPRVTQATIRATICVPGYTRTVRPPVRVTTPIKYDRMRAYGYTGRYTLRQFELDHLVPLELGGAPAAVANLWPQWNDHPNRFTPNSKDLLENRLHTLVCQGRLPLRAAQAAVAHDWVGAYHRYVR